MRRLIVIIAIILALGFFGLSHVMGHQDEETEQERTQMTQMMDRHEQMMGMMKNINMKMDKMMSSCMGMMQKMHGSEGGMMEHHEGMME